MASEKVYNLNNGINVHFIDYDSKLILVRLAFSGGSITDEKHKEGQTHLLEHLIHREIAIDKRIQKEFENKGLDSNGLTNSNYMQIEFESYSNQVISLVSKFSKVVNHLVFDDVAFKSERYAVISEFISRKNDNAITDVLFERLAKGKMMTDVSARRIETIDSINKLTNEDVYKKLTEMKKSSNIVFVFVGKISEAKRKQLLSKLKEIKLPVKEQTINQGKAKYKKEKNKIKQISYNFGALVLRIPETDIFTNINFFILTQTLIYWQNSKLYKYLRENLHAAYYFTDDDNFTRLETMKVYLFEIADKKKLRQVIKALNLNVMLPTKAEFEIGKERAISTMNKQTQTDIANFSAMLSTVYNRNLTCAKYLRILKRVTYDDFTSWYKKLDLVKYTLWW